MLRASFGLSHDIPAILCTLYVRSELFLKTIVTALSPQPKPTCAFVLSGISQPHTDWLDLIPFSLAGSLIHTHLCCSKCSGIAVESGCLLKLSSFPCSLWHFLSSGCPGVRRCLSSCHKCDKMSSPWEPSDRTGVSFPAAAQMQRAPPG